MLATVLIVDSVEEIGTLAASSVEVGVTSSPSVAVAAMRSLESEPVKGIRSPSESSSVETKATTDVLSPEKSTSVLAVLEPLQPDERAEVIIILLGA